MIWLLSKWHHTYPILQINVSYYECYQTQIDLCTFFIIRYVIIFFPFLICPFFVLIFFVDEQYLMFHRGYQRGLWPVKDAEDGDTSNLYSSTSTFVQTCFSRRLWCTSFFQKTCPSSFALHQIRFIRFLTTAKASVACQYIFKVTTS